MAAVQDDVGSSAEVAILGRILAGDENMTRRRAEHLLELRFTEEDQRRMHDLAERNQAGALSTQEREELLGYAKAGCLLGIVHARARRFLRRRARKNLHG